MTAALHDWRQVLDRAHEDLEALRAMRSSSGVADRIFGFHAQQAAEKALKAWIGLAGSPWPFLHDIGALVQRLEQIGCDVSRWRHLTSYTSYAVTRRYVASPPSPPLDRDAVVREISEIVDHVEALAASR